MNRPQFNRIYARYGDRVYRFCYPLCGSEAEAEDLAQETFLRVFRGLEKYEGRASVLTWLVLMHERPYKQVWPGAQAVEELQRASGRLSIQRW